jgi:PTH1 family peptidyl-tRNA hydrolase
MKLILGLGNIGAQYAATRHNIGFMVLDELARNLGATWRTEAKLKADVATTELNGHKLLLAKPHTMMNLSGEAARRLMDFYKLEAADVWAIFAAAATVLEQQLTLDQPGETTFQLTEPAS